MNKYEEYATPELLEKVNPENIRLRDDFLSYLHSVQRSPGTITVYRSGLNMFFVYDMLYLGNKEFWKISKRDIISFQGWAINERGLSPARVHGLKAAVSSLSNYIENILSDEEEFKNYRPVVRKIESPAIQPVRKKTVLSDDQLEWLLNELVEQKKYEQACVLSLAINSGRRKSELLRFRVDDFKPENLVCDGALYKTTETIKTKGRGLGKYIYCYTLAKKFQPYLDMWMKYRQENGIESEWLFPNHADPKEQLRISTLNTWAKKYSEMLGVNFYWHCLRHAFTTSLARAGLPDGVIQDIVGWESADMVRLYNDIPKEEQIAMWFKDGDIYIDEKRGSISNI